MGANTIGYTQTESESAFIRKAYDQCSSFITICGGFQNALAAGLLKDKTATAPRPFLGYLRETNPETNWVERRWARDGKIWTSGTLLNGLDLMSEFARQTWANKADMMNAILDLGAWPVRDVEYRDVDGKI